MIIERSDPGAIEILRRMLSGGAAGVLPCDTIYGLCAMRGVGLEALRALKPRSADKPFLLICAMAQAEALVQGGIPERLRAVWPAPLTAILPAAEGGTLALRVPDDPFLQRLMEALGAPLYSTSVNESGCPALVGYEAIRARYEGRVDFIVKGGQAQGTVPSTLIDATARPWRLVRPGAYDATKLLDGSL